MNAVTINGVTITSRGSSIVVSNGKVIIDGVDYTPDGKEVSIAVTGNVERLEADSCETVHVTGNVGNVQTQSGDVEVGGSVSGSVTTMSGDVDCGTIGGSVSTMSGNVKHHRTT